MSLQPRRLWPSWADGSLMPTPLSSCRNCQHVMGCCFSPARPSSILDLQFVVPWFGLNEKDARDNWTGPRVPTFARQSRIWDGCAKHSLPGKAPWQCLAHASACQGSMWSPQTTLEQHSEQQAWPTKHRRKVRRATLVIITPAIGMLPSEHILRQAAFSPEVNDWL